MSTATVANIPRISKEALSGLIKTGQPGVAVIDVRDDDFIGGHIIGAKNVPVPTHDYRMPELVRTLKDQETVVFHCHLSQVRGPKSALRYIQEKQRMDTAAKPSSDDAPAKQKVYVLEGGFQKWQEA